MVGPFDISLKVLLQSHPRDWARFSGLPAEGEVELFDTDLATVAAEADKVIRVSAPVPYLLQIELQANRDPTLPDRVLLYNELLTNRHELPVVSVVILLRRAADGDFMTGLVERRVGEHPPYLEFRYRVIRVWEIPVDEILQWGVGALPMAPLANGAEPRMSEVFEVMDRRIQAEASDPEVGELWSMTQILLGLRYRRGQFDHLIRGVQRMKESVTYQAIVEEGREKGVIEGRMAEAQRAVVTVASLRFSIDAEVVKSRVAQVKSLEKLEELLRLTITAPSWDDVLRSLE